MKATEQLTLDVIKIQIVDKVSGDLAAEVGKET